MTSGIEWVLIYPMGFINFTLWYLFTGVPIRFS
jgi:hypothetical protein